MAYFWKETDKPPTPRQSEVVESRTSSRGLRNNIFAVDAGRGHQRAESPHIFRANEWDKDIPGTADRNGRYDAAQALAAERGRVEYGREKNQVAALAERTVIRPIVLLTKKIHLPGLLLSGVDFFKERTDPRSAPYVLRS